MKKRIIALALAVLLLAGCANVNASDNVPQASAETVEIPLHTEPMSASEPETEPETEPAEEPEQPEPCILPAEYFFSGHMQYAFGIELANDTATDRKMTSLTVTDYRDGQQCAFREVTPEEMRAAMQGRTPELDVPAGTHTVQFVVEEPENIDFDQRVMEAVISSADGEEIRQSVRYTMHPEEAAYDGAPDGEIWNPSLYFENYGSVNFPCVLFNDSDQTMTLKTAYSITYVNGVPLRNRIVTDQSSMYVRAISCLEPRDRAMYIDGIGRTNAFWNHIKWVYVYETEEGKTVTKEYRFVTPAGEVSRNSNLDALLALWGLTAESGERQYSAAQIRQMIDEELTLDEVAEKISTIADLVQYLYLKHYSEDTRGDLEFSYQGNVWHVNRSARTVFRENRGNCGGDSNLANYILRGDYDEEGYIHDVENMGGHIFNYFRRGDRYFVVDFTNIVAANGKYDKYYYQISQVTDLRDFSETYVANNHSMYPETVPHHIRLQYAYPCEGSHGPMYGIPMTGVSAELQGKLQILCQNEETFAPGSSRRGGLARRSPMMPVCRRQYPPMDFILRRSAEAAQF